MSKYPSSFNDASSISNQPLIPKTSEPKDYEAAAAALMSSYGLSGTAVQSMPTPSKQKKETKSSGRFACLPHLVLFKYLPFSFYSSKSSKSSGGGTSSSQSL